MATYHLSIKSGKKGSAANHSIYISRQGKFRKQLNESDLAMAFHGNLPTWAENDPKSFWRAADRHERANGSVYRELEIALPNELSLAENIQLVREYVTIEAGPKTHQVAIHAPIAAIGECAQPHAHIMISDRLPDEIQRSPEQHFRRFNPSDPELGGCKKDSGGRTPSQLRIELQERRQRWAQLQNTHLEKAGSPARVDERSHTARGIQNQAETHLGQAAVRAMGDDRKASIRHSRTHRSAR